MSFVPFNCEEEEDELMEVGPEQQQQQRVQQALVKSASLKQLTIPGMAPLDNNSGHIFQDSPKKASNSGRRRQRSHSMSNLNRLINSTSIMDTPPSLPPTTATRTRRSRATTNNTNSNTTAVGRQNSGRGLGLAADIVGNKLKETFDKTVQLTKTSFLNNVTLKKSTHTRMPEEELEQPATKRNSLQKQGGTLTLSEEQIQQSGVDKEEEGLASKAAPTTAVRRENGRLRRRTGGGRGEWKGRSFSISRLSINSSAENKKKEGTLDNQDDDLLPFDSHGNRRRSRSTPRLASNHSRRQVGSERNLMACTLDSSVETHNTFARRNRTSLRGEDATTPDNVKSIGSGIRRTKSSNAISRDKQSLSHSSASSSHNAAQPTTTDEDTDDKVTNSAEEKAARRSRRRKTARPIIGQRASSQKALLSNSLSDYVVKQQQQAMDGSSGSQAAKTATSRRKKGTTRPMKKSRSQSSLNTGLMGGSSSTTSNHDFDSKRQALDTSESDTGGKSNARGARRGRNRNSTDIIADPSKTTLKRAKSGSSLVISSKSLSSIKGTSNTRRTKKTSLPSASATPKEGKRTSLDAFLAPTGSSRFDLDALLKDFSVFKETAKQGEMTLDAIRHDLAVLSADSEANSDDNDDAEAASHQISLDALVQGMVTPDSTKECSAQSGAKEHMIAPYAAVEQDWTSNQIKSNNTPSVDDAKGQDKPMFCLGGMAATATTKDNDEEHDEDSTIASVDSSDPTMDMDESLKTVQRVVQDAFLDATTERTRNLPDTDRVSRADTIAALSMLAPTATQAVI